MGDEMFLCMASCHSFTNSGALVGNDSYDLECINQCSERHTTLYLNTAEKYAQILQIIAVVLITFGLIGKFFNCIIFLRKPLRGTSTGLLLLLKTIFDAVPLLWTFIFDTKFFLQDEQINGSRLLCVLSRSTDIFVSWSIGFVILACTVRLFTIVHGKYLPQPTRLHVFVLILLMMVCGLIYNWQIFYYPNLVKSTFVDNNNSSFTYCNVLFGRQMGYFSFSGFQVTQELFYNGPIINFIVSSIIPFTIVASTNVVIIVYVLKVPAKRRPRLDVQHNGNLSSQKFYRSDSSRSSIRHIAHELTKKDVSYETTITLTTSFVFLTTNSIASIYVYVKSSYRSNQARVTEDLKASNVYLILRMLALIDTVFEFYIYFITGKKFRQEVFRVIVEILQHTPLKHYFKFTCLSSTARTATLTNNNNNNHTNEKIAKTADSCSDLSEQRKIINVRYYDVNETLDRIESTV
ncbi:unnamed protein product [Rotaria magnacalcarata]|uniref:G-protein coupled receptors family 1 profile domain-containing protein n=3 Tax=Rotaria magnacalcarata TaxID=392030 RepID=A0A816VJN8_9BILA|nr:unnamed protein product [Rotaria magnacalcarata]CAF1674840.1 unnamed protein product [Rotaria magnacalcarata]CAF1917375.1 unnamed protein product [Rotaria magnacalcarata]CAF2128383.1 unnamed protein product [Rotaria magnacalcarata]CAF2197264.1 unnamed protein product [Rotaria magnacalcarata]